MRVEIIPQGQFDRDSADDPLQPLDAGAAHAVVGVAQGAGGVGDAANGEIGGVGDADEVGFCEHGVFMGCRRGAVGVPLRKFTRFLDTIF